MEELGGDDSFRVCISSADSLLCQGSNQEFEDDESLRDIFIWGKGTGDGILGGGGIYSATNSSGTNKDSLVPKALESAVDLDVQNIACGVGHATLVTKQGEVFSWGEELGGRLGHAVDSDVSRPKLVESLKNINIKHVACGEYHSCAVSLSGDLYTWGGSASHFGILGHGNHEVSLWFPKKVNGPLEGIYVSSVSCGPWHTAVVTSAGQLFTFGDGSFGVLGHGDRTSVSIPREVESLKGLRTVRAACGAWHTAALVETMIVSSSSSINCSSGKLFTWGDGDKGRLGHGDREARLVPTCVAALVEPNFCQVVCGHSLTVALATTGHVFTMGSPVYGQLGNPQADGKLPILVEGKLTNNFVEDIACGAYHVAVLTSRNEVYSWGKGDNGRLGHGDDDYRVSPTLIEALKDKQVKSIACGSSFTAAICLRNRESESSERRVSSLPNGVSGSSSVSTSKSTNSAFGSINKFFSAFLSRFGFASQKIDVDDSKRTTDAQGQGGDVSEQLLIQGSINSSIDIREANNEDDELHDHSASKVKTIIIDRAFVVINFIMEVPSAVFDQLSSVRKPQYALISMLLSFMAMLICITELVYKGGVERVGWKWREKIPWFYLPAPSDRRFGTVTDFIGLICGISQFIVATNTYANYLQHTDNPIEISLWPLVFASCLMGSKFINNHHEKMI